jgi:hypothetical protein
VDQKEGDKMKMQDEKDAVLSVDLEKREKELADKRLFYINNIKELESLLKEVEMEEKLVFYMKQELEKKLKENTL